MSDLVAFDWSRTPVGPKAAWSLALQTAYDIIMSSNFGMCIVWGPRKTMLYNEAFAPFLGKRHPGALGRGFDEVWSDVWSEIGPLVDKALSGTPVQFDNMPLRMTRNGHDEETYWTFSYSPPKENGRIVGILDIAVETTASVLAQQQLETRVQERTQELMAIKGQVQQMQKMEAIGQLTGGVAHDFNNLLTVIRSSADLLQRRALSEERRELYIKAISETADRAAKLTSQLLAFSRRQALRPETFELSRRVDAVTEMLRTVVGARIHLGVTNKCTDACFVEADANQFETALINVVVNARDAMGGAGRLAITIGETELLPALRGHAAFTGRFVTVAVADSGSGIAADKLDRIFEPFFTTKDIGKGTGLGLSQVYGFAKQSGGDVQVESIEGKGATFTLYLPRVDPPISVDSEVADENSVAGQGCVLVVEDNSRVGEFATQLLEDLGYSTRIARNGVEALATLEEHHGRIDIVFTDVVMPGMSGIELGRRIRERWPAVSVILTSGYSQELATETQHGFPLLQKPYSVEELSRIIRTATPNRNRD